MDVFVALCKSVALAAASIAFDSRSGKVWRGTGLGGWGPLSLPGGKASGNEKFSYL